MVDPAQITGFKLREFYSQFEVVVGIFDLSLGVPVAVLAENPLRWSIRFCGMDISPETAVLLPQGGDDEQGFAVPLVGLGFLWKDDPGLVQGSWRAIDTTFGTTLFQVFETLVRP